MSIKVEIFTSEKYPIFRGVAIVVIFLSIGKSKNELDRPEILMIPPLLVSELTLYIYN